jgi:hypothetical protein
MARLLPRTTRTLTFPITFSMDADAIDLAGGGARLIELREWGRNRGRLVGEMRPAPAYISSAASAGFYRQRGLLKGPGLAARLDNILVMTQTGWAEIDVILLDKFLQLFYTVETFGRVDIDIVTGDVLETIIIFKYNIDTHTHIPPI